MLYAMVTETPVLLERQRRPDNMPFSHRPQCGMTAVNMAYRGQQGFVTGSSEALLLLYCNVATKPCGGCFKLSGPPASNIEVLETGENTAGLRSTVYVSWQSDYQGSVSVSVDQSSR